MTAMAPHQSLVAVIDDDVSMREALAGLISSFGFRTVSFGSAGGLLESKDAPPSCLVVDVQMPGMGGLELQSALAAADQHIPMIFVTSFPDDKTRARALAAGAAGFLGKPVDRDELLRHIHLALRSENPKGRGDGAP